MIGNHGASKLLLPADLVAHVTVLVGPNDIEAADDGPVVICHVDRHRVSGTILSKFWASHGHDKGH
jgi:hypothetical protein